MEHVEVQGITVPRIGFGTWQLTGRSAYDGVAHALAVGYRHIDTAQMYGNEEEVGRAVADSGVPREEVFVTTKISYRRAAAEQVRSSHEESLRRLGMDHVDLLLLHWPADVPMEETLGAMDELRQEGTTRAIGVSNYPSDLLDEAAGTAPIVTDQVEYHPYLGQQAVLATVRKHGLFLTAYSPLAHGQVTDDDALGDIAAAHDATAAQVALAWLLGQDDVVVIPRSSSPEHIEENLGALELDLTDDEAARIDDLPKDRRLIDPAFAPAWD